MGIKIDNEPSRSSLCNFGNRIGRYLPRNERNQADARRGEHNKWQKAGFCNELLKRRQTSLLASANKSKLLVRVSRVLPSEEPENEESDYGTVISLCDIGVRERRDTS
jgi:hypothetical protein